MPAVGLANSTQRSVGRQPQLKCATAILLGSLHCPFLKTFVHSFMCVSLEKAAVLRSTVRFETAQTERVGTCRLSRHCSLNRVRAMASERDKLEAAFSQPASMGEGEKNVLGSKLEVRRPHLGSAPTRARLGSADGSYRFPALQLIANVINKTRTMRCTTPSPPATHH